MSDDQRYSQQQGGESGSRSPEYGDNLTREDRSKGLTSKDEGGFQGEGGLTGTGMTTGMGDGSYGGGGVGGATGNATGMGQTGTTSGNPVGRDDTGSTYSDDVTGTRPAGFGATGGSSAGSSSDTSYSGDPTGDNTDGAGRDRTDAVTSDETGTLISADKVQGTPVYDAGGERLGTIDSLMLNKRSGKVAYAVMSFGGFLGIGERYHPLPWDVLTYDVDKGGYNVGHTGEQMRTAPNYSRDEIDDGDFSSRGREVDDYYGRSATQSLTMPTSGLGTTSALG